MPVIDYWFDEKKKIDWAPSSESPLNSEIKGPVFFEYPITYILPQVKLRKKDLKDAPTNLWVVDIDVKSRLGKVNNKGRKELIIDLPESFQEYLRVIPSKRRKKFKYISRKNSDLRIVEDNFEDLKTAWPWYVERLHAINRNQCGEDADETELNIRWEIFNGKSARTLSFYKGEELVGVNVSLWSGKTVYDLAFLRKETDEMKKRALGFFAILKNIGLACSKGMKCYDLLTGDFGYKAEFATRQRPLKQYIRCTEEFAKAYNIPLEDVCELVNETDIEKQLHPSTAVLPGITVQPRANQNPEKPARSIIAPMRASR